ncbi:MULTISPECIES: Crp/Fnr family transcriptional regulator [unclassified Clostridium]|uniref:Crp/Fnr family transcriptional regulator n=1 Tax=unclassified Clostridium TaxID=2614128 RepID=UPI000297D7B0|nr:MULTISPECIES: Crp/Fnr family transcriptional regulator [unclassified Clostridium]EKQ57957.1 MAG: cAMP-binding protein [Clostridium sp. Maddingley MBC34-26]
MICKPSDYIEAGFKMELQEDLKELFNSTAAIRIVPKGTIILRQGEIPSSLYYIHKGIIRGYYIDESGNDVTKCFACETEFACAEGLLRSGETTFSVESLEDCICVIIPYGSINQGMKESNQMKIIFNEYIRKILINTLNREKALLMKDALERYKEFKREYSSLEDRINQAYIASFIGVRASSLSRIKRSMKTE